MADSAAAMPTQAIGTRPLIRIGRSTSGCERRSLIADANMQTYMPMYRMIEMSCSIAKAAEVLGATTNTSDRIVTMTPWNIRIGICTSFLLTFWKRWGGSRPGHQPHAPARAGDPGDRGGHRAEHEQAGQDVRQTRDPEAVGVHREGL